MKEDNKKEIWRLVIFYSCTIIFFIDLFYLMLHLELPLFIKIIICTIFGFIFGYMIGSMKIQRQASKNIIELTEAMDNYYTSNTQDLEMGNLAFNPNTNQCFSCPDNVIQALKEIRNSLDKVMKKQDKYYDNPFDNTGNTYKNNVFEVQAYNWNDEICQPYNFKYKDIKISWYKYLGRDTTINKQIDDYTLEQMIADCIQSLQVNTTKTHYNKK